MKTTSKRSGPSFVRSLPRGGGMSVDSAGEYPGFQVGQKGGTIASWRKPARKYAERALQLGTAGLSAAEGSYLYNSSVAAVLGYVEQLCPTGKEVTKLEQGAIERALHAPQLDAYGRATLHKAVWHDQHRLPGRAL